MFIKSVPVMDWLWGGIFLLGLIFLIACADGIRKLAGWPSEVTRKFVHIFTGILISFTPFLFKTRFPLLAIALIFIIINFLGVKYELMKGMHGTERTTYGTIFYPVAFFILVIFLWENYKVILIICMLIMALADAVAAIVGEGIRNPREYILGGEKKSVQGSVTMFVATVMITLLSLYFLGSLDRREFSFETCLWFSLVVGAVVTVCEAISFKGSDNLTVPLGAAFTTHFMVTHSAVQNGWFTLGVILALAVAYLSLKAKFLDSGGAAVTFLLGALIFGTGHWTFSVPILTFFILSSLISKSGKRRKEALADTFQKSSRRDLYQVLANGGVAGILMICWNYFPDDRLYFLYLGTMAAVTADTWGTEIGIFSKIEPRWILNFKKVPPGTSGGITLLGTLGALAGAIVIALAGRFTAFELSPQSFFNVHVVAVIVAAGVLASFVDSFLGATVQAHYRCSQCGKITEKVTHCGGIKTELISGCKWVDNDVVNGACALSGVLWVWLGFKFI